jgi:hypothetical protein
MCLGGHLVRAAVHRVRADLEADPPPRQAFRAAFDRRVLSTVCFFATDIHSATLGAGGDDSLARVHAGELAGKGELVVRLSPRGTQRGRLIARR